MNRITSFFKKNYKKLIIVLILVVVVFLFVFISNKVNDKVRTFTIKDQKFYQYLYEQRVDYETQIVFSNEDGITRLKMDEEDESRLLDSSPFYYDDMDMVLFPQKMSVVFPRDNVKQEIIPIFTIVDMQSTDFVELKNNNTTYDLQDAFIYDGSDLYFFVTETELKYNDKTVKLSPLSFVRYNNLTDSINYYNYDEETAVFETDIKGDVFALTDKYTINLKIDGVKQGEDYRLLIKKLDILNKLF